MATLNPEYTISPTTKRLLQIVERTRDNRQVRLPLQTLIAATNDFRPKQHPVGRSKIVSAIGHARSGLLVIRGRVLAKTDKTETEYRTSMSFFGVRFGERREPRYPISLLNAQGFRVHAERLRMKRHPVRVRCSCKDYYFTFWFYDNQHKAHLGPRMPPYVRKTDYYPERNPLHIPGLCKHLMKMVQLMKRRKIIVP